MATSYLVLGQSNPAATTATTLYTASAATVISSIVVCNQASSSATFRIAVRPAGAALAAQHYIVYGATVPPSDSTILTLGITMAATDVLTVYASSATMSFSAFGSTVV